MYHLPFFLNTSVIVGLLFCGALGLLTFFILLLYIRNRENIYLYYFLFLIFSLIGGIINLQDSTWLSSFFEHGEGVAHQSLEAVTLLALFAYCAFTNQLLEIKQQNRKLAQWIVYLAGITAIYGVIYWLIYPIIKEQALLYFIISRSIILPMSLIAIVWVVCKIHSPVKGYFIFGSAFYFTGALFAVLRETVSTIPLRSFYVYDPGVYFQSGILLETICFALALSHRFYLLHQAKQQEQENIRVRAVYERDLAQAQMLASRMQINPHFIFNCLNAIKYFIQSNQNKSAIKYLAVFSRFIRTLLDSGRLTVVSLSEEIKIIEDYLILEAIRFDENFTHQIKINENVDVQHVLIPPLLLQPFIEDAIWNSLLPSEELPRKLTIDIRKTDSSVIIFIADNGIGGTNNQMNSTTKFHKTTSDQVTEERIKLYNKNYKGIISYTTRNKNEDRGGNRGTLVTLTIEEYEENK